MLTYEEFLSRETRQQVKEWTRDGDLRLALNCVGGKETTEMVKLLGMQGYLGESSSAQRRRGKALTLSVRQSPTEAWPKLNYRSHHPYSSSKSSPRMSALSSTFPSCAPFADLGSLLRTGLWLSQWVSSHPSERLTMMNTLASMVSRGELKEPEVEIVDLAGGVEEMARRVREVMKRSEGGRGRKVLLRFVECE